MLKTKTVYDFELMEELQRIAGQHFAPAIVRKKRTNSVTWGVFLVCAGIYVWARHQFAEAALVCWMLGALLVFRGIFYIPFTAFLTDKTMKPAQRVNTFDFEEEGIRAHCGGASSHYLYSRCFDLMETERCFYFVMKNDTILSGLMMEKQYVIGGKEDDLRRFLEEKTGKTFHGTDKKKA